MEEPAPADPDPSGVTFDMWETAVWAEEARVLEAYAPPSPIVPAGMRPIGEARNWQLLEPLVYRVGTSADSVVVPAGFVTDFASIPPRLQSLISALGPYVLPAVVHDYLYWNQGCSRPRADRIFLLAMEESGVGEATRKAMYRAVDLFGFPAWLKNRGQRRDGLPRIVPAHARPAEPLELWREYRRYLKAAGVAPIPGDPVSPEFCAHGDRAN